MASAMDTQLQPSSLLSVPSGMQSTGVPTTCQINIESLNLSGLSLSEMNGSNIGLESWKSLEDPALTDFHEQSSLVSQESNLTSPQKLSSSLEQCPPIPNPSLPLTSPEEVAYNFGIRGTDGYAQKCREFRKRVRECNDFEEFRNIVVAWDWFQWYAYWVYCSAYEAVGKLNEITEELMDDRSDEKMLDCIYKAVLRLRLMPEDSHLPLHHLFGSWISKGTWGDRGLPLVLWNLEERAIHLATIRTSGDKRSPQLRYLKGQYWTDGETNCSICKEDFDQHQNPKMRLPWFERTDICLPKTLAHLPLLTYQKNDFKYVLEKIWENIDNAEEGSQEHTKWMMIQIDICQQLEEAILRYLNMTPKERAEAESEEIIKYGHLSAWERVHGLHTNGSLATFEEQLECQYEQLEEIAKEISSDKPADEKLVDRIVPENAVETPCGHRFGYQCLGTWLISNDTCPLCRAFLGTGIRRIMAGELGRWWVRAIDG